MKYKYFFQIALALSLIAAVAASPAHAKVPGYVYSTDDITPVRDMDGHCVRTQIDGGKEYAIKECIDSDGDGVPDYLDKCPNTPKGEKVDKDGCSSSQRAAKVVAPQAAPVPAPAPAPAPVPPPVVAKAEKKVSISLEIEFDTGKAVIKPQYDDQIKNVADFMTTYPETTAVIEGHTDNVGKESSNVTLSKKRAESVRTYLIEKFGIAPGRLTAKGFGSSKPVADNKTAEGRQKNRRIDAVIETMTKDY